MIAKANRFHGHNSLSAVYRKGQSVSLNQVSLKYLTTKGDKRYRLAVVVSRKVDKSAVVRNRIRRRVYETMSSLEAKLNQKADIVISIHNPELATIQPSQVQEILNQLLLKAGLIDR